MDYSKYIDHTYLKAEGTTKDINKLVQEAIEYNFKTVCVNGS
jgi:deoxyribose-phosphate aldolase